MPRFVLVGPLKCSTTTVQIIAENRVVAVRPRHTEQRLLIDPRHYNGPGTVRVLAPPPLGRMGERVQALAAMPVAYRAIDLYAGSVEAVCACRAPRGSSATPAANSRVFMSAPSVANRKPTPTRHRVGRLARPLQ